MTSIIPSRTIAAGILVDATPISRGLANVYRGADLVGILEETSGPGPRRGGGGVYRRSPAEIPRPEALPVIVRVAGESDDDDEPYYERLFRRITLARHRMTGTPAPRLLHTFGLGTRVLVSVEEYVSGTTLEDVLRVLRANGAQMPVRVALAIGQCLLPLWMIAVPNGIRVSVDARGLLLDAQGEVRVIPAYREEQSRHVVGAALFSLQELVAMASPEEITGAEPDGQSAMFHFGLLLYQMLAGSHPAASGNQKLFEVLSEVAQRDAPHLRQHRSDVHPVVAEFVRRCLARKRGLRFTSWPELVAAFTGVRALFPPTGPAEILAYLCEIVPEHPLRSAPPVEVPDDWRALPSSGYHPVNLTEGPFANAGQERARALVSPALDSSAIYRRLDGRPMYAVSEALLVDARPVTRAEIERYFLATRTVPPAHLGKLNTATDDDACTLVSADVAEAYAAWTGKRLPSEAEWEACVAALGRDRLGVGNVWEWTSTPHENGGRVVRGGRWRDQLTTPSRPENRSFATSPAPDLGFRCVADA
jgi:hypothetical protein